MGNGGGALLGTVLVPFTSLWLLPWSILVVAVSAWRRVSSVTCDAYRASLWSSDLGSLPISLDVIMSSCHSSRSLILEIGHLRPLALVHRVHRSSFVVILPCIRHVGVFALLAVIMSCHLSHSLALAEAA